LSAAAAACRLCCGGIEISPYVQELEWTFSTSISSAEQEITGEELRLPAAELTK
jgi:hypothetical protein